jgi:hypothetical protein
VHIHTTASWPAREDRGAALVWLAIFWIFVGVGFGFDLLNYFHEQPPVPKIVHVHAIATTLWLLIATALVLMVETGDVRFHRRFGWFAAGYAALIVVIAPWSDQFLWAAFLVIAVGLAAMGLYFNETWKLITRSWLEGWARNML